MFERTNTAIFVHDIKNYSKCFFTGNLQLTMASTRNIHLSTLSPDSKRALQSGSLTKMLNQLNKLRVLYKQGTAKSRGALHRHVIAMKQGLSQHIKQFSKLLSTIKDTMLNTRFTEKNHLCDEYLHENNDQDTLSRKHMRLRKAARFNTRKKVKAESALEEEIYKHYYFKLIKLTKMRESLHQPSYLSPSTAKSNGMCLDSNVLKPDHMTLEHNNPIPTDSVWDAEAWKRTKFPFDWKVRKGQVDSATQQIYTLPYKVRFKNLLYKVMVAWNQGISFSECVVLENCTHSVIVSRII